MRQKNFLLLTLPFFIGCSLPSIDVPELEDICADLAHPLHPGAVQQGLCGGGETGGDQDVQDPDDSKPNGPHYDSGCLAQIENYENWRADNGYHMSGPLDEEGDWTNMADHEWPVYMISIPLSVPRNMVGRPHDTGFPPELECDDTQDFTNPKRSCLIGNYGLYATGVVPSSHPRPPWVRSVFEWIGHPEIFGRVTAVGDPCCGVISEQDLLANVPEFYKSDKAYSAWNNESCAIPVDRNGTHEVWGYPRSNLGNLSEDLLLEQKKDDAVNASMCLNNGGEWDVQEALFTAPFRNGLIWLNLSETTFEDQIQSMAALFEEGVPFWGEIVALMEQFGWYGLEDEIEDPPFFAYTGVCGYKCSVAPRYVQGYKTWWSGLECPQHLSCVLPDFSLEEENVTIEGFCELETFHTPAPPGLGNEIPPEILSLEESHGLPNHWIVNIEKIDVNELLNGLSFEPDPEGFRVYFNSSLAQELASEMGLSDGDVVVYALGESMKNPSVSASILKQRFEDNYNEGKWTKLQFNYRNENNILMRKHLHLQFNYI